jgi:hypothetical protein
MGQDSFLRTQSTAKRGTLSLSVYFSSFYQHKILSSKRSRTTRKDPYLGNFINIIVLNIPNAKPPVLAPTIPPASAERE